MFGLLRKDKEPLQGKGYLAAGGKQIPFTVRRYPKSKGIRLIVSEDAKLKITAPLYVGRKAIDTFIRANREWILQQVSYFERLIQLNKEKELDKILYLGQVYAIESKKTYRNIVLQSEDKIVVGTKNQNKAEIRTALASWYKKQAKKLVIDAIRKYKLDVDINRISIRDQRTCWGSASSLNNINFNWKLAMAPIEVLEYVVIHELSHLKHMNHSKTFWKLVEKYSPNYKQHKKWLRQNKDLLKI
jgi:predicted metal-dependent hydrolase